MVLTVSDQAQLMAESLDIDPTSYAGQEPNAIVAMTLVAGYRQMIRSDQEQVLPTIAYGLHFGMGSFFLQCQTALAMMIANPVWVPGSLTNDELEKEIRFWRGTSTVLTKLGFSSLSAVGVKKGKGILSALSEGKTLAKAIGPVKMSPALGATVLGGFAQEMATSSVADLSAEATRRGMMGTMSELQVSRYGSNAR